MNKLKFKIILLSLHFTLLTHALLIFISTFILAPQSLSCSGQQASLKTIKYIFERMLPERAKQGSIEVSNQKKKRKTPGVNYLEKGGF